METELLLAILASLIAAALFWLEAPVLLRLPVGLPAGLLLPGYCLSAAVFPRAHDLEPPDRLALGFGLSIAIIIILALALSYSPWGLASRPIVLALTGVTVSAAATAWWRRERLRTAGRRKLSVELSRWSAVVGERWLSLALMAGALLLAGTVMVVSVNTSRPLTEFFVLNTEGWPRDYPRSAVPGDPISVTLGVTNREREPMDYRVIALLHDQLLAEIPTFRLEPDAAWSDSLVLALPHYGLDQRLQLLLMRPGDSEPYRRVELLIDVPQPGLPTPAVPLPTPTPRPKPAASVATTAAQL